MDSEIWRLYTNWVFFEIAQTKNANSTESLRDLSGLSVISLRSIPVFVGNNVKAGTKRREMTVHL